MIELFAIAALRLAAHADKLEALAAPTPPQWWRDYMRKHPSAPRSRKCSPMSAARELHHWRHNRKRWMRRHNVPRPRSIVLCQLRRVLRARTP